MAGLLLASGSGLIEKIFTFPKGRSGSREPGLYIKSHHPGGQAHRADKGGCSGFAERLPQ